MIYLSASDSLRLVTSTAATMNIYSAHAELGATSVATAGRETNSVSSATTTTIAEQPLRQKVVQYISVYNRDNSLSNNVTIELFNGTSSFVLYKALLGAGESVQYSDSSFKVFDGNGVDKSPAISGYSITVGKVAPSNPQVNDLWVDTN